ncbi:transcription antitermination protein nusG [Lentibacillus halodurans]|uniref:Transcription termination/antitermination protein NusG n=2 Tax=Lentibacillus halodurans TaxID=237679 RepID=A0A1I1A7B1_9BACI|nr:transcription antitermination protein nusG [Lentibacillus halodurans]
MNKGGKGKSFCPVDMEKNWYAIHTYSGYENKVKTNLEKRVDSMGMEDKIFRVLVPENEETEIKNGRKKTVKKKFFPGYVLAEMVMTDDSWYVVRNTPGVTGFVGSSGHGTKPTPLLPDEIEAVLKRMGITQQVTQVDFELKENVRVTDGPFSEFTGTIEHIDADKQKVKVHVNMFGRETPVELEFSQIEKL